MGGFGWGAYPPTPVAPPAQPAPAAGATTAASAAGAPCFPPAPTSTGKRFYSARPESNIAVGVYCGWGRFLRGCAQGGFPATGSLAPGDLPARGTFKGFATLDPAVRFLTDHQTSAGLDVTLFR